MNWYVLLANAISLFHLGYVLFVVLGLVLIYVGWAFKWKWVRNFWFRIIHLAMIAIVVLETAVGWTCPLTTWEVQLRQAGGQDGWGSEDFVARCVNAVMFFEPNPDHKIYFTIGYFVVGALIFLACILVRPNWPWRQRVVQPASTSASVSA